MRGARRPAPSTGTRARAGRALLAAALAAAVGLSGRAARADDAPDGGLAVIVGAGTLVAGMAAGGTLLAATHADPTGNQAGWLVMQGGFAVAPFAAHGVVGEWGRGAVFASVPALAAVANVPVFLDDPSAVATGTLWSQRLLWGFFCGGLATGIAGIVDAALAPGRAIRVVPAASATGAGLTVAGAL